VYQSHPNELIYTLLEITNESFEEAKIQQSDIIKTLLDITTQQIDKNIVNQVMDKFFMQNKVQMTQHIQKLHEKIASLETERNNLQHKIQRSRS
jgi:polyhydroxyalkanoate synthesis regulator phasin